MGEFDFKNSTLLVSDRSGPGTVGYAGSDFKPPKGTAGAIFGSGRTGADAVFARNILPKGTNINGFDVSAGLPSGMLEEGQVILHTSPLLAEAKPTTTWNYSGRGSRIFDDVLIGDEIDPRGLSHFLQVREMKNWPTMKNVSEGLRRKMEEDFRTGRYPSQNTEHALKILTAGNTGLAQYAGQHKVVAPMEAVRLHEQRVEQLKNIPGVKMHGDPLPLSLGSFGDGSIGFGVDFLGPIASLRSSDLTTYVGEIQRVMPKGAQLLLGIANNASTQAIANLFGVKQLNVREYAPLGSIRRLKVDL